jgi:hypothetical protein
MKSFKYIFLILIVFLKTGNVLSNNNIFDVNNINIEKREKTTNTILANQAIQKGFKELIDKILLEDDRQKLKELKFSQIKELVTYYQVLNITDDSSSVKKMNFNVSFDKEKIHNLFYQKGISYSEINSKELFILPILKKNDQIFIYSRNFFYEKWNKIYDVELIEFILPIETIEIIQNINMNKNNLLKVELQNIFKEYRDKNLALVFIEDTNSKEEKIYIKTKILGKNILNKIEIKRNDLNQEEYYKKIITEVKKKLINLVKSQNLIDIRVPSFLNAKLKINKNSNLVVLNSRLKKIDLIEKIYVQEFNNDHVNLKIKYLGKLENILRKLKNQKIILELIGDEWRVIII